MLTTCRVDGTAVTSPVWFQYHDAWMVDPPVLAHAAEILRQAEALPRAAAGRNPEP
jgi:hypothetical protein